MLTSPTLRILAMLEGVRRHRLAQLEDLGETEATTMPPGFRNHIHWHIGHILHVQLAHWYIRRGLPLPPEAQGIDFKRYFRDGKSPLDYDAEVPTFARLLELYRAFSLDLAARYGDFLEAPMTEGFKYLGMDFRTVSDDLYLLLYHDGEHGPMLDRLLRAIGKAP